MGLVHVVFPRQRRLTMEILPLRPQDALSNDLVVLCISQHCSSKLSLIPSQFQPRELFAEISFLRRLLPRKSWATYSTAMASELLVPS